MVSLNRSGHFKARMLSALTGALLLSSAHGAAGATANATMMVSVTVEASCTVSANPLAFGSYQPGRGPVSGRTTLAVLCSQGAPFVVALDAGTAGSVAQRVMTMGTAGLQYNLYTTPAHTTVWGDGTQGSATVSGTGHGLMSSAAITETVYGRLLDSPGNAGLAPGLYTDTITLTITY
ncbi:MAG TPA: spore coat U domain-containing protein [Steroidobacteraceae bacterium]|nr:spore coat U domain-containing protein [Steroidobacteraceae bacterium]